MQANTIRMTEVEKCYYFAILNTHPLFRGLPMGGAIKSESGSKVVLRHGKITGSDVAITATDSTVQLEDVYAEVGVVVKGENVDIEANRITHIETPSTSENLTLSKNDWRPVNGYD